MSWNSMMADVRYGQRRAEALRVGSSVSSIPKKLKNSRRAKADAWAEEEESTMSTVGDMEKKNTQQNATATRIIVDICFEAKPREPATRRFPFADCFLSPLAQAAHSLVTCLLDRLCLDSLVKMLGHFGSPLTRVTPQES
jgi:hypothetical protein